MSAAMNQYVGKDVIVPGSEWQPAQAHPAQGYIVRVTRGNGTYPKGRFEIYCVDDRQRYMFPVDKFPTEWILDSSNYISLRTPAKSHESTNKTSAGSAAVSPPRGRTHASSSAIKMLKQILVTPESRQPAQVDILCTPPPIQSIQVTPVTEHSSPIRSPDRSPIRSPVGSPIPSPVGSPIRSPVGSPIRSPAHSPVRSPSPSQRHSPRRGKTPKSLLKRAATPSRNAGRGVRWLEIERAQESARKNLTLVPGLPLSHNLFNAAILVAVALPALLVGVMTCTNWAVWVAQLAALHPALGWLMSPTVQQGLAWVSSFGRTTHPLVVVNVLLLLNVDVLFYIVSRLQGNTWLIDPYWTLIPLMIQLFYANHPDAVSDPTRARAAQWLTWVWSARLTWSYFRREEWQFGAREDWRYTDLARTYTRHWWWMSFLATYLVQHVMLFGITLPLYAVYSNTAPWGPWDTVATVAASLGMCCSWAADTQLRAFMMGNEERMRNNKPLILILDTGLWRLSRHPNYFGEQLYWWGMGLFATGLGHPEVLCGTLFNSLCMVEVTRMTEARMMRRPERKALYEEYRASTNMWVPWPRSQRK